MLQKNICNIPLQNSRSQPRVQQIQTPSGSYSHHSCCRAANKATVEVYLWSSKYAAWHSKHTA